MEHAEKYKNPAAVALGRIKSPAKANAHFLLTTIPRR